MRGSLQICRVFGIRIQVHFTFALLLFWFGWAGYEEARWQGAKWSILFLLAIFICVVLHELGHSLVAQRLGIAVRNITLLPIGGMASLGSIPENPKHELAITIAGPLVNVMIFGLLYVVGSYVPFIIPFSWPVPQLEGVPLNGATLWGAMLYVNLMMIVFNLIPAFPMDGGRIVRAMLVYGLGYLRATQVAATIGQVIAAGFFLFSCSLLIDGNPAFIWLGVIGTVIFIAAGSEQRVVKVRFALRNFKVADVMSHEFAVLAPDDSVGGCLEKMVRNGQDDFPVVQDGELIGLLDRDALRAALHQTGSDTPVSKVMRKRFPSLAPETSLENVHAAMFGADWKSLPVRSNGALVGWLPRENIGRFFVMQEALLNRKRQPRRQSH